MGFLGLGLDWLGVSHLWVEAEGAPSPTGWRGDGRRIVFHRQLVADVVGFDRDHGAGVLAHSALGFLRLGVAALADRGRRFSSRWLLT